MNLTMSTFCLVNRKADVRRRTRNRKSDHTGSTLRQQGCYALWICQLSALTESYFSRSKSCSGWWSSSWRYRILMMIIFNIMLLSCFTLRYQSKCARRTSNLCHFTWQKIFLERWISRRRQYTFLSFMTVMKNFLSNEKADNF